MTDTKTLALVAEVERLTRELAEAKCDNHGEYLRGWNAAIDELCAPEWRPIEAAPTGADLILTGTLDHDADWRIKVGHRCAERHNGWRIYGASWEPLFWMPLPTTDSLVVAAKPHTDAGAKSG